MIKKRVFIMFILMVGVGNVWADLPATDKLKGLRNALDLMLYNKQLRSGGGKCLAVVGNEVKTVDCNADAAQRWLIKGEQIRNINAKCLECAGEDLHKNGGRVQVSDCNDSPGQKWRFDNGRLTNGGGKCLDVTGPDLHKNGGMVQVWDCNTAPNQQWQAVEIK